MPSLNFKWTCPHCGLEQRTWGEVEPWGAMKRQIVRCDLEEGGCDKEVAVEPILSVTVKTYKLVEATHNTNLNFPTRVKVFDENEIPIPEHLKDQPT